MKFIVKPCCKASNINNLMKYLKPSENNHCLGDIADRKAKKITHSPSQLRYRFSS